MNVDLNKKLVGKKLLSVITDQESDQIFFFFEGFEVISVDQFNVVSDGKVVAQNFVNEKINEAESVLFLRTSLQNHKDTNPKPAVKAEATSSGAV